MNETATNAPEIVHPRHPATQIICAGCGGFSLGPCRQPECREAGFFVATDEELAREKLASFRALLVKQHDAKAAHDRLVAEAKASKDAGAKR